MTRKEAIWYLQPIADSASLERYKEALGMAIAALREQDVTDTNVGDKTNADHIRSMTDEELAKFIPNWSYTDSCKCGEHYVDCNNECEKCVAEWLQQPYKEET